MKWCYDKRAKHSYTSGRLKNVFSGRQIGSSSRRDTCSFLHSHAAGDRETTWEENGRRKKNLALSKHPLQYRKWRNRLTWKACTVLKASPATKAENSLSVAGKMKNVVVRLSTSSLVSWWQVWKQMHSWLFRHADGERKPSARSIRRYSRKSCYYQKKKRSKVVYLKIQIQWILSCGKLENWDWTLRRWHNWKIFRMHPGAKLNSGKKRQSGGIIQKGEPHERNPCALLIFRNKHPEETSRQAGCTSKVAWNLARKYASSSRRQLRFILLWRRQRHIKRVCLLWIRELQCTMLSKENWAQIQWILWQGPKTT